MNKKRNSDKVTFPILTLALLTVIFLAYPNPSFASNAFKNLKKNFIF